MPSTSTAPSVGASSPPARLSSVDLPEPDGPITATSSPSSTVEADAAQRVHGGVAGAVDAGDVAQLEHAHRGTSSLRGDRAGCGRERCDPGLAVVEPADLGLGLEDHRLEHEQPGGVGHRVGARLEPGQVLEAAQRGGPLHLHDPMDIHARRRERKRELDRELVSRSPLAGRRARRTTS